MSEESTTPDLADAARRRIERVDQDWDLDALAAAWSPDIVWDNSAIGLGVYTGIAAVRKWLAEWWSVWEDHHHRPDQILDLGHGVVCMVMQEDGLISGSEARVERQSVLVSETVDGKVVRYTAYPDIDAARAATEGLAGERGQA